MIMASIVRSQAAHNIPRWVLALRYWSVWISA